MAPTENLRLNSCDGIQAIDIDAEGRAVVGRLIAVCCVLC